MPPGQLLLGDPLPAQPNAPAGTCPGQNSPLGSEDTATAVVNGVNESGIEGRSPATGGAQWNVAPDVFIGVQDDPASGDGPLPELQLGSQIPDRSTPGVPPTHLGHGEVALPVR